MNLLHGIYGCQKVKKKKKKLKFLKENKLLLLNFEWRMKKTRSAWEKILKNL